MHSTFTHLGATLHKWTVGPSVYLAAPTLGARLMNWHLNLPDGGVRDIIHWPENVTDLTNLAGVRGGNPILFPFAGRSHDGGEPGWWRFEDKRLPMPQHGFARQGTFRLIEAQDDGFIALFVPDEAAKTGYPFPYEFTVRYHFEELVMRVEFRLHNLGRVPMPWSPGHHFYFQVPWQAGATRSDYQVSIPAKTAWRHEADGSLMEINDFRTTENLGVPELSNRLHADLTDGRAILSAVDGSERVILSYGSGKAPSADACVVVWTEKDASPFYCVEPWMGLPNGIANGRGVKWIPAGKIGTFEVSVTLE